MVAVRTTVTIDAELLAAIDEAVRCGGARSRNDLINQALRRELKARRRAEIAAAWAAAATDEEFLAESEAMAEEFATSSWEAFLEGERAYASG